MMVEGWIAAISFSGQRKLILMFPQVAKPTGKTLFLS
jgi:hypothetical protein